MKITAMAFLFTLAVLACTAPLHAGDAAEADGPVVSSALDFCAAPPPPVCPPPPPVCQTPRLLSGAADVKVIQVPVKTTVCEVKTVPVTRRVTEEECYVVNVPRTSTYNEVRTRTRERTIEVPDVKLVTEARIMKVASASGKANRLARGSYLSVKHTTRKEKEEYVETYLHPVKYNYTEAVAKTRKVTRKVEEYKTVSVPRTVTTMETRVVTR